MLPLFILAALGAVNPADRPPYSITARDVSEVCLIGLSPRHSWETLLAAEGLHPTLQDGQAVLLLCTLSARFMGIRFREGFLGVFTTTGPGSERRDGTFLVRAHNALASFAWVERVLNKSPYTWGDIQMTAAGSRSTLFIGSRSGPVLEARMVGHNEAPVVDDQTWEGRIDLPSPQSASTRYGFYVKLEGTAHRFPFLKDRDTVTFANPDQDSLSRIVTESGFTGLEWMIRVGGTHSKTRTIRRPEGPSAR